MVFNYFGNENYATVVMDLRSYDAGIEKLALDGECSVAVATNSFEQVEMILNNYTVQFRLKDSEGDMRTLNTEWTPENLKKRGLQFSRELSD